MLERLKRNFKIIKIEKILGEKPQNNNQQRNHNREDVEMCFKMFIYVARQELSAYYEDYLETATLDDCNHILKLLRDNNANYRIINLAFRFCCISAGTYIEYYIPYFATHEDEFTD